MYEPIFAMMEKTERFQKKVFRTMAAIGAGSMLATFAWKLVSALGDPAYCHSASAAATCVADHRAAELTQGILLAVLPGLLLAGGAFGLALVRFHPARRLLCDRPHDIVWIYCVRTTATAFGAQLGSLHQLVFCDRAGRRAKLGLTATDSASALALLAARLPEVNVGHDEQSIERFGPLIRRYHRRWMGIGAAIFAASVIGFWLSFGSAIVALFVLPLFAGMGLAVMHWRAEPA